MMDYDFPEKIEDMLETMLTISSLDYVKEEYIEMVYNFLRLEFNEDNECPERFDNFGVDSRNFLVAIGPITIYTMIFFLEVIFNELIVGVFILKICKSCLND